MLQVTPRSWSRVDTLFTIEATNRYLVLFNPFRDVWAQDVQPLDNALRFGVSARGDRLVLVEPGVDSQAPNIRITWKDPEGHNVGSRLIPWSREPVTEADVAGLVDSLARRHSQHQTGRISLFPSINYGVEEVRRKLFVPRYWPPVLSVVVGRDGTAWLLRGGTQRGRWTIVDSTGAVVGEARLPATAQIVEAERHMIWAFDNRSAVPTLSTVSQLVRYHVN